MARTLWIVMGMCPDGREGVVVVDRGQGSPQPLMVDAEKDLPDLLRGAQKVADSTRKPLRLYRFEQATHDDAIGENNTINPGPADTLDLWPARMRERAVKEMGRPLSAEEEHAIMNGTTLDQIIRAVRFKDTLLEPLAHGSTAGQA